MDHIETKNSDYAKLANLFEYPDATFPSKLLACGYRNVFTPFVTALQGFSLSQLQELYTRTFDLNPVCALEIGYHLFGENYKRGEFLAGLRETEAPFELGQKQQLPDYLPVLLRLLTQLQDHELRDSLIGECMIPAIDKMLGSFKDGDNPYRSLLEVLRVRLNSEVLVDSRVIKPGTPARRMSLPVIQPVFGGV